MRRVTLLLLLAFMLVVETVSANIILTDPNQASVSVKITNLADYPDMALVYYYDSKTESKDGLINVTYRETKKAGLVTSRELPIGKFNCPMTIYVVEKSYLAKVDVNKIDWTTDEHANKLNLFVEKTGFRSTFYSHVDVEYKLAKKNKTFYLYKSKLTGQYRNPTPDLVKTFADEVVDLAKPMDVSLDPITL